MILIVMMTMAMGMEMEVTSRASRGSVVATIFSRLSSVISTAKRCS